MHRLNELAEKLTPTQLREVEDFAEFLLSRQPPAGPQPPALVERDGQQYLNVDAIVGMFPDWAPGKTSVELQHEALEARANED
jgi:hypothetical protein